MATSDREKATLIFGHILPSSVWVSHWHVATTATPPRNSTWMGRRRTSAGTYVIIIPAGGRHWSSSPPARGHSFKPAVSTAGPVPTHGEPSHKSATASPLFKHHGETTIFIRFIVEVRVIGLSTSLYRSLKREDRESCPNLLKGI